jgi:hypothetical protein
MIREAIMTARPVLAVLLMLAASHAGAQQTTAKPMRPEDTEVWTPVPKVVGPGKTDRDAPSDAIVLFNGATLDEWVSVTDGSAAQWTVANGVITVKKSAGDIRTKRSFRNFQLHLEWLVPAGITGSSQLRGNSGVFLAYDPPRAAYELQIVDSYENPTYVNGQAGSVYKENPPLVNAMRKPGEWQTYDVIWTAPVFNDDGSVQSPAYVTALHNGVLVQNHFALTGITRNTGLPEYVKHGPAPIMLQAHQDPSAPISFRNIWLREIP